MIVNTNFEGKNYIQILGIIGIIGYVSSLIIKNDFAFENYNVFLCLYSIYIFNLFATKNFKCLKVFKVISKYSLTIYIVHPFYLNLLNKGLHVYPDILPIGLGEIAFFSYAFLLSLITAIILTKIPFLKKIL